MPKAALETQKKAARIISLLSRHERMTLRDLASETRSTHAATQRSLDWLADIGAPLSCQMLDNNLYWYLYRPWKLPLFRLTPRGYVPMEEDHD